MSVEAEKWIRALRALGLSVATVAGEGDVDVLVPGLAIDAPAPPPRAEVDAALAGADLVVVENLCSLPMNPAAASVVATALLGRPAILHHHDLPWQRARFAGFPPPPDDPAWAHVTINDLSRRELEHHGIRSTTVRNAFDTDARPGERARTRAAIGVGPEALLVLQPTRAIERKRVPVAVALAEELGAHYWLLGPPEEGYDDELARVLACARVPVHRRFPPGVSVADAYAACDAVAFPSSWEGFGNPTVESAVARRNLAIGDYPVAAELAQYGFRWIPLSSVDDAPGAAAAVRRHLHDDELLDHNLAIARRHFSLASLGARLAAIIERWD